MEIEKEKNNQKDWLTCNFPMALVSGGQPVVAVVGGSAHTPRCHYGCSAHAQKHHTRVKRVNAHAHSSELVATTGFSVLKNFEH